MAEANSNGQGGTPNQQQGNNQQQANTNQQSAGNQSQQQPPTFDSWFESQPEEIKGLIDSNVSGLKSALDSERNERKSLAKQLSELKGKAEKGSELEQQLTTLSAQLESQAAKAAFYESAPADVANMKLAWMAAQDGHTDKRGNVDWNSLRSAYPELFRKTVTPPANAGNGRGQEGGNQPNMNAFIRAAAGRNG